MVGQGAEVGGGEDDVETGVGSVGADLEVPAGWGAADGRAGVGLEAAERRCAACLPLRMGELDREATGGGGGFGEVEGVAVEAGGCRGADLRLNGVGAAGGGGFHLE